jgi:SAM-dependent methyltransferase
VSAAAALPSPWFTWHAHYLRVPGARALDLACGRGRHALAAALCGAQVTAADHDAEALAFLRRRAAELRAGVTVRDVDLAAPWPAFGTYDCVMVFNYLDRARMRDILDCVAPGGVLVMETFLRAQRTLGWGPSSDAHLLAPGELAELVRPFEIVHGREVMEPVGGEQWRAVAGIVARRPR